MERTLNFLKVQPLTNWLDYFLDRRKFFALLEKPEENATTILQLADQFVEQALASEKEIAQAGKKQLDEDDIIYINHKMNELWMCGLSCLAASGWDLEAIVKSSNVIRIRALLSRMSKWVFSSYYNDQNINKDAFSIFGEMDTSSFNSSNVFTVWLFARWIFLVDRNGRFPTPTAKPTVSNPMNQMDPSLVQAERISQAVADARKMTPIAARMLNMILKLDLSSVQVPNKDCFYVSVDSVPKVEALKKPPSPIFSASFSNIPVYPFRIKTHYDLLVAHFAARHFLSCRHHLSMVLGGVKSIDDVDANLGKLINLELADLDGYKAALNVKRRTLLEIPDESDVDLRTIIQPPIKIPVTAFEDGPKAIIKAAELGGDCPANLYAIVLKQGQGVSKRLITNLGHNSFRNEFLEAISQELFKLSGMSQAEKQTRARMITALYFLCSLSPGFSEDIAKHPQLCTIGEWRKLAKASESFVPPIPSNKALEILSESGPPLWNILTSFNLEMVRDGFSKTPAFKMPFRHQFSVVMGDAILNKCGTRNYNKNAVQLWKIEQLVALNNIERWKSMINNFVSSIGDLLNANQELPMLLTCDLIRVEIDVWNKNLYKRDDVEQVGEPTSSIEALKKLMDVAVRTGNVVFTKFAPTLVNFLLNNRKWKIIMGMDSRCFQSPFIDLARVLAKYFLFVFESKDIASANLVATGAFWQVMWPTFEASNPNVPRQGRLLLSRHQFQDFLALLKEKATLDFFFGYVIYLYNATLAIAIKKEEDSPLASMIIANKRISNVQESMWKNIAFDANVLDVGLIVRVLEILCSNAMLVDPVNVTWLMICGDFNFARDKWNEAATLYLEVITAAKRGFSTDLTNLDMIYSKISLCCWSLQMPTLAAITGQLRADIKPHLPLVEWMLKSTPNTVDAGPAYFSLIADIDLMECMTVAYNAMGLSIYAQNLIKSMPTKAINVNNAPEVLQREVERRKKRFLDILFNQFFKQNL